MKLDKNAVTIIAIFLGIVIFFSAIYNKEKFSEYINVTARQHTAAQEIVDAVTSHKNLSFIGEPVSDYEVLDYQKRMCIGRSLEDKSRVCRSIPGLSPIPELSDGPKNFTEF
jgi:hypothetical protein